MKLHSKKDIFYLYKYLFLALIPLIIFGIIKNGLLLSRETSSTYIILKPTIYFLINFALGFILDYIDNKKIKIGKYLVMLTMLFMIISINTSIWLLLIGDLLLVLLLRFDKEIINKVALTKLIIIGVMFALHNLSFTNVMEASGSYVFSFMDLIIKGQIGGIATCNLLLVAILMISLLYNIIYKRNLALISILTYALYFGIISIIHDPNVYLKLLINSTALFELIMVGTINNYSPRTPKGEVVYGLLLGIVSAVLCNYVSVYIGTTIAIVIISPLRLLFDKIKLFR